MDKQRCHDPLVMGARITSVTPQSYYTGAKISLPQMLFFSKESIRL